MRTSGMVWAFWWIAPVIVVFVHFGPGQRWLRLERASEIQRSAAGLETQAQTAQDQAYQLHLTAIAARKVAGESHTPESIQEAARVTELEEAAYANAASLWKSVADEWTRAVDAIGSEESESVDEMKIARARALVRAGDVWGGIGELESIVERRSADHDDLHIDARTELATAYYYAGRLLRMSGMPPQEWLVETSMARQNFRYLAEHARQPGEPNESSSNYQRNLELVLNLEQSDRSELTGKPLPRNSPRQGQQGNRSGPGRKSKRPPQQRDGRGAGGAEDIPPGW